MIRALRVPFMPTLLGRSAISTASSFFDSDGIGISRDNDNRSRIVFQAKDMST